LKIFLPPGECVSVVAVIVIVVVVFGVNYSNGFEENHHPPNLSEGVK
jgi:hypothetical protein